jgi:prepilin-type N-terminal cleavage/methylation domain-containing protein
MSYRKKGFTLVELVVVMGIMSIIGAFILPLTATDVKSNNAKNAANNLTSLLYSYQSSAYSGKDNKSYGLAFDVTGYTLFIGSSLATAESTERINLDSGIYIYTISLTNSSNEIVFSPNSIKPLNYGEIRVSSENGVYGVSINQEGFIDYYRI